MTRIHYEFPASESADNDGQYYLFDVQRGVAMSEEEYETFRANVQTRIAHYALMSDPARQPSVTAPRRRPLRQSSFRRRRSYR